MDIFEKADYLGLKDPLEVWVHYEICNTICGIPVPAILNHKNSTGSAGGAKNSQNGVFLAKKWGSFTRERLVEMIFFIK